MLDELQGIALGKIVICDHQPEAAFPQQLNRGIEGRGERQSGYALKILPHEDLGSRAIFNVENLVHHSIDDRPEQAQGKFPFYASFGWIGFWCSNARPENRKGQR
jgi:hypothetical protein